MDFFGAQDRARRFSAGLVALFALAVALIILSIYAALVVALAQEPGQPLWQPDLFLMVAGGVSLVVLGSSLIRTAGLRRGGGRSVAEMLGGRLVQPDTGDTAERRLRNVVEEMALAAGTPVPAVYVLEHESAINAFAAGYSPDDAVVAVTKGALDALTRDELQAVVAHEFSHITNRDIRLNIRLTGILFGILALGLGGRLLLRSSMYSRGGRRDGKAVAIAVALGLALFIAGYVGVFFGRIIRASISRQREYLADAAAVQFTRNPDAMASTLKKIGAAGSRLETASAEEVSHFFFANGLRSGAVSNLWATHPPLVQRIRRLDPQFDGDFSKVRASRDRREDEEDRRPPAGKGRKGFDQAVLAAGVLATGGAAAGAVVTQGAPAGASPDTPPSLGDLPGDLLDAAHEPFSAVALTYALVLDRDPNARPPQLAVLEREIAAPLAAEVHRLQPAVDQLPEEGRLALVDLAAPALSSLSEQQAARLSEVLGRVARADNRLSLFEFALETTLRHRLAATHGRAASKPSISSDDANRAAGVVLAALAHAGSSRPEEARAAFEAGAKVLGSPAGEGLPVCTSNDVIEALEKLAGAREEQRRRIVEACGATARHDHTLTADETHLLRAIAAALDAPAPAFLPRFRQPG